MGLLRLLTYLAGRMHTRVRSLPRWSVGEVVSLCIAVWTCLWCVGVSETMVWTLGRFIHVQSVHHVHAHDQSSRGDGTDDWIEDFSLHSSLRQPLFLLCAALFLVFVLYAGLLVVGVVCGGHLQRFVYAQACRLAQRVWVDDQDAYGGSRRGSYAVWAGPTVLIATSKASFTARHGSRAIVNVEGFEEADARDRRQEWQRALAIVHSHFFVSLPASSQTSVTEARAPHRLQPLSLFSRSTANPAVSTAPTTSTGRSDADQSPPSSDTADDHGVRAGNVEDMVVPAAASSTLAMDTALRTSLQWQRLSMALRVEDVAYIAQQWLVVCQVDRDQLGESSSPTRETAKEEDDGSDDEMHFPVYRRLLGLPCNNEDPNATNTNNSHANSHSNVVAEGGVVRGSRLSLLALLQGFSGRSAPRGMPATEANSHNAMDNNTHNITHPTSTPASTSIATATAPTKRASFLQTLVQRVLLPTSTPSNTSTITPSAQPASTEDNSSADYHNYYRTEDSFERRSNRDIDPNYNYYDDAYHPYAQDEGGVRTVVSGREPVVRRSILVVRDASANDTSPRRKKSVRLLITRADDGLSGSSDEEVFEEAGSPPPHGLGRDGVFRVVLPGGSRAHNDQHHDMAHDGQQEAVDHHVHRMEGNGSEGVDGDHNMTEYHMVEDNAENKVEDYDVERALRHVQSIFHDDYEQDRHEGPPNNDRPVDGKDVGATDNAMDVHQADGDEGAKEEEAEEGRQETWVIDIPDDPTDNEVDATQVFHDIDPLEVVPQPRGDQRGSMQGADADEGAFEVVVQMYDSDGERVDEVHEDVLGDVYAEVLDEDALRNALSMDDLFAGVTASSSTLVTSELKESDGDERIHHQHTETAMAEHASARSRKEMQQEERKGEEVKYPAMPTVPSWLFNHQHSVHSYHPAKSPMDTASDGTHSRALQMGLEPSLTSTPLSPIALTSESGSSKQNISSGPALLWSTHSKSLKKKQWQKQLQLQRSEPTGREDHPQKDEGKDDEEGAKEIAKKEVSRVRSMMSAWMRSPWSPTPATTASAPSPALAKVEGSAPVSSPSMASRSSSFHRHRISPLPSPVQSVGESTISTTRSPPRRLPSIPSQTGRTDLDPRRDDLHSKTDTKSMSPERSRSQPRSQEMTSPTSPPVPYFMQLHQEQQQRRLQQERVHADDEKKDPGDARVVMPAVMPISLQSSLAVGLQRGERSRIQAASDQPKEGSHAEPYADGGGVEDDYEDLYDDVEEDSVTLGEWPALVVPSRRFLSPK